MKKGIKRQVSIFLALLLSAIFLSACSSKSGISAKIPNLELKDYQGNMVTVNPEQGPMLLVFWATWCQPCIMEIPSLMKLHEKYGKQGIRIIALNMDDPQGDKVKAISEQMGGINYPNYQNGEEVAKIFGGVSALPTSFLVDKKGKIVEKMQGLIPEYMLEEKIAKLLPK